MTDAQIRAQAAYRKRHLDRIELSPQAETGAAIRSAAAQAGQSVQRYILDAVQARMERETAPEATGPQNSTGTPQGYTDTT